MQHRANMQKCNLLIIIENVFHSVLLCFTSYDPNGVTSFKLIRLEASSLASKRSGLNDADRSVNGLGSMQLIPTGSIVLIWFLTVPQASSLFLRARKISVACLQLLDSHSAKYL